VVSEKLNIVSLPGTKVYPAARLNPKWQMRAKESLTEMRSEMVFLNRISRPEVSVPNGPKVKLPIEENK
jgi:hypothetical protein